MDALVDRRACPRELINLLKIHFSDIERDISQQ